PTALCPQLLHKPVKSVDDPGEGLLIRQHPQWKRGIKRELGLRDADTWGLIESLAESVAESCVVKRLAPRHGSEGNLDPTRGIDQDGPRPGSVPAGEEDTRGLSRLAEIDQPSQRTPPVQQTLSLS